MEIIKKGLDLKKNFFSRVEIPKNYKEAEVLVLDKSFQAPESFDWRLKGAVTSVKDQHQGSSCGSW
jgi:C1A family cysteine protease